MYHFAEQWFSSNILNLVKDYFFNKSLSNDIARHYLQHQSIQSFA